MKQDTSLLFQLLVFVRDNPGATGSEIREHFQPIYKKHGVTNDLGRLRRMRLIENNGNQGRYTVWYPVKLKRVKKQFSNTADELLDDMRDLPPQERKDFLARFLQDLCS